MPSPVYFCDLRASLKRTLLDKISELIRRVELPRRVGPRGLCALKLHFGERGNTAYIRPVYLRPFVEAARAAGAQPFLTDCNTLYVGSRSQAVAHLTTAIQNGFAYSVVQAPLVIADGLKGKDATEIPLDLPDCDRAYIGNAILEADSLICLTHFKGHELTGFGGTLKNLGMGCGSRQGKLYMHSNVSPSVKAATCIACGQCIRRCPAGAIKLVKRTPDQPAPAGAERPDLVARKDESKCIGCGDCILACPTESMQINWNAQVPVLMRRMVGHAWAAVRDKGERCVYFNFLTQISPACDCYPFQDAPVVADLGILASSDPVALDQASADLVNQAPGSVGSCLKHALAPGQDKFRDLYPKVDWQYQLEFAEQIGLGSRSYDLVSI